jgi:hypothetical protein
MADEPPVGEQHPSARFELISRCACAALAAVLVGIVFLHASQRSGRLASDLAPDDVAYAIDAAKRLVQLTGQGLFAFVRELAASPPHSPFSTLLAMGSFALGGLTDTAPYAGNVALLVLIALFVTWELRLARRIVLVLALAIVLSSPLAFRTVHDFRPDVALGFATAAMVWWFASAMATNERRLFRFAACAFGACLWIKPTFFAHTVAIALFLAGFGTCISLASSRWPRLRLLSAGCAARPREAAGFVLLGLAIWLPYILLNWRHTFGYFWENTHGAEAAIWSFPPETPLLRLLYETLALGFAVLGYHVWLAAALIAVGGAILLTRGDRTVWRLVTMLLAGTVSVAVLVYGRHKNEFFLASFQWLVFLAGVFAMAHADALLRRNGARAWLGACAVALVAVIDLNATLVHWRNSPDALHGSSWNERIIALLKADRLAHGAAATADGQPVVYVPFAGPVGPATLEWIGLRERLPLTLTDSHRSADATLALRLAAEADYVVLPNEQSADYYRWLPSASIQPELLERLASDSRFVPLDALAPASKYFVFANRARPRMNDDAIRVDGLSTMEGFLGREGPYPQWSLPVVRWMHAPEARVCMRHEAVLPLRVVLRFRPELAGRLDLQDDGGAVLSSMSLTPGTFEERAFTYTPRAPKSCLILKVNAKAPAESGRVLLFTQLEIRDAR